jgi:hypothetical protein
VIITLAIGVDHMKYVLTQNQTARISGTIAAEHHMMGFIPIDNSNY